MLELTSNNIQPAQLEGKARAYFKVPELLRGINIM
jgi:hypothetical protein